MFLIFGTITSGSIVFATDSVPEPIFDLDLSAYNETSKTVKSKASAAITSIGVYGSPTLGKVNDKPYLTFATSGATLNQNRIMVNDDSFIDQKELTFEFWARDNNSQNQYSAIFSLANSSSNNDIVYIADMISYDKYIFKPSGELTGGSAQAEAHNYSTQNARGNWSHYVLTRKYDTQTSKYIQNFYLNGDLQTATSVSNEGVFKAWNDRNFAQTNKDMFLTIGNLGTSSRSFVGDIAEFRVYSKILTDEQIVSIYDGKKDDFIEFADTMELASVSIQGDTISAESGEITLQFNNYVDAETVEGSINILNADGTELKGGVILTAGKGLSKTVKLKYGNLELGEKYILNITSDLKSVNAKPCIPVEREYTAQTEYIFYEDFMSDDFVIGENPPTDKGIRYISSVWNEGSQKAVSVGDNSSNMVVCGDETFKYISMNGGGNPEVDNRIKLNFSEKISDEAFVIDYKVRPNDADGIGIEAPRNLLVLTNQNSSELRLADMRNAKIVNNTLSLGSTVLTGGITFSEDSKDENGFYDMRVLFQKNEKGFYVIKVTNANAPEDGKAIYETKDMTGIQAIELSHLYPLDASQATKAYSEIAKIAIYAQSVPDVLYTDLGLLSRDEDEFCVVFTDDIDAESINQSSFVLSDESDNKIEMEFVDYIESERKAIFKLNQYLKRSREYTFSYGNMKSKKGLDIYGKSYTTTTNPEEIAVTDVVLENQEGEPVDSLSGAQTIKVTANVINNSSDVAYVRAALVIYDENGRVIKGIFTSADDAENVILNGKSKKVILQTIEGDLKQGGTVKLLIWKKAPNGAVPITEVITYQYGN